MAWGKSTKQRRAARWRATIARAAGPDREGRFLAGVSVAALRLPASRLLAQGWRPAGNRDGWVRPALTVINGALAYWLDRPTSYYLGEMSPDGFLQQPPQEVQ